MSEDTKPSRTTLIDEKIKDLKEDIAALEAKLSRLETEKKNAGRVSGIAVGQAVKFDYGRGEKRRELEGTVTALKDDEKKGRLLAVTVGEGFDLQVLQISAGDVKFDDAAEATGDALAGIS